MGDKVLFNSLSSLMAWKFVNCSFLAESSFWKELHVFHFGQKIKISAIFRKRSCEKGMQLCRV
jgi:hypothetical protein